MLGIFQNLADDGERSFYHFQVRRRVSIPHGDHLREAEQREVSVPYEAGSIS